MNGRTGTRLREISRRTKHKRRKSESRMSAALSAAALSLSTGLGALLQRVQPSGVARVAQGYSSVLLREGGGAYVALGVAAFASGVTMTALCVHKKRKNRAERAENLEESI